MYLNAKKERKRAWNKFRKLSPHILNVLINSYFSNLHRRVTINSMNDSNRWHITENLLTTEEREKEKRDEDRGGSIYQSSSPRFLFMRRRTYAFLYSFGCQSPSLRCLPSLRDSLIRWCQPPLSWDEWDIRHTSSLFISHSLSIFSFLFIFSQLKETPPPRRKA